MFLDLNAQLATTWPSITVRKPALPDADRWNGEPGKRVLLER